MKTKLLVMGTLVAAAMLVGSGTTQADHYRSCYSGGYGYSPYSYGYSYAPTYSYAPAWTSGYSSYSSPGYSFSIVRPGLSLSIGSGYYYRPQYYSGYGFGSGYHSRHHHHHR